jgi:hypothetical protein
MKFIRPDMRELARLADDAGFTVTKTRKNHHRVTNPEGRTVAVFPNTPSDRRAYLNARAVLRRAIKEKGGRP